MGRKVRVEDPHARDTYKRAAKVMFYLIGTILAIAALAFSIYFITQYAQSRDMHDKIYNLEKQNNALLLAINATLANCTCCT
jgi:hypothetical protein